MNIIEKFIKEQNKIDCIGCNQYNPDFNDDSPCNYNPHYKGKHCPCLECILKMICGVTCQEYEDYYDFQTEDLYEKDNRVEGTKSMHPEDPSL